MPQIVLEAEAGQVSAELVRHGNPADARVHVQVDVALGGELPMAATAQAGGGWTGWPKNRNFTPMSI